MRVALFGGSFDPPHHGHVALARLARERFALDRILVAPVGAQPLKPDAASANFEDRLAMTRLAFAGESGVEISLLDAPREDGRSNYTVDTVEDLRRELNPDDKLFCMMGADSLLNIRQWHRPSDLLLACDFIVGARPGFDLDDAEAALPREIQARPIPTELPATRLLELTAPDGRQSRVYLLTDLNEDISATKIRAALRGGEAAEKVLAPEVLEYIRAHRLY
jgi:nicotinate-nucleotide adenylyltransferase